LLGIYVVFLLLTGLNDGSRLEGLESCVLSLFVAEGPTRSAERWHTRDCGGIVRLNRHARMLRVYLFQSTLFAGKISIELYAQRLDVEHVLPNQRPSIPGADIR
jgi:hypothetical protein